MSTFKLSDFLGSSFKGEQGETGPRGLVIEDVIEETTSRTLNIDDASGIIYANSSSALTFTIPNDSSVDFPIPSTIHFARNGTGSVTIANEGGVTVRIRNGFTNTLAVQYSIASATKIAANTWYLYGDLT